MRPVLVLAVALLCCASARALQLNEHRQVGVVTYPQSGSRQRNLAVPLQSRDIEVQQGSATEVDEDPTGKPPTLPAMPLEGDSGSDSLQSSYSSEGSGSMMGTSVSGSGSGSVTPIGSSSRCVGADGITPGPCGGGGALKEAKIVPTLSGGKKYVDRLHGDAIWAFKDGADIAQSGGVTPADVQKVLDGDSVLAQLSLQLESLETRIGNEKIWVEDVKTIIEHYKAKIGAVLNGLKGEAQQVKQINKMINERKKLAQRKALEYKLLHVNDQLQKLQISTSSVTGEAQSLKQVQRALKQSIQTLQSDITRLRR